MNAALLAALAGATLGLALSFTTPRARYGGLALALAGALIASRLDLPRTWATGIGFGCCASIVAGAAALWWPGGLPGSVALILSLTSGLLLGAAAGGLPFAALAALVALPGAWLVRQRLGLGLRVAGSWLAAVALLAAVLPLVATPGYVADHRA